LRVLRNEGGRSARCPRRGLRPVSRLVERGDDRRL
jgi:hypothetical protein